MSKKDNPPFTPDKPHKKEAIAGKYGYGYSLARHLARLGLKKQIEKGKKKIQESRRLEIVREALKKGKEKPEKKVEFEVDDAEKKVNTKKPKEKFEDEPIIAKEIVKTGSAT